MTMRSDGPITRARAKAIARATASFVWRASQSISIVPQEPATWVLSILEDSPGEETLASPSGEGFLLPRPTLGTIQESPYPGKTSSCLGVPITSVPSS